MKYLVPFLLVFALAGCRTESTDTPEAPPLAEASGEQATSQEAVAAPDSLADVEPRIVGATRGVRTGLLTSVLTDDGCMLDMDIEGEPFLFMATPEACAEAQPLAGQQVEVMQAAALIGEQEAVLVVGVTAAE